MPSESWVRLLSTDKRKLHRAVKRLVAAESNYEWRGTYDPAQRLLAERELHLAREHYRRILEEMP